MAAPNRAERRTGTHYAEIPIEKIKAGVWHFLAAAQTWDAKGRVVPYNPNKNSVANTVEALAAHGQLQGKIKFPYWKGEAPVPASEVLSCKNGLLHLPTRQLLPHTPLLRNTYALDYDFDPNAPDPPQWLGFLDQLWPADIESIETFPHAANPYRTARGLRRESMPYRAARQ